MNEELLRKALADNGLDADKINAIVDAQKAAPAATDEVPVVDLQKSLTDLAALLAKPHEGPTEEQLQAEIKKAVATATEPVEKYAKQLGATADMLVKAVQDEMVELRKSLAVAVDVITKLVGGYDNVKKSIDASAQIVADAAKKDPSDGVTEAVKKALDTFAPATGRSVQGTTDLKVEPHPGETPVAEPIKKSLTVAEVVEIIKACPDAVTRSRALGELVSAGPEGHPERVLKRHGIPYKQVSV